MEPTVGMQTCSLIEEHLQLFLPPEILECWIERILFGAGTLADPSPYTKLGCVGILPLMGQRGLEKDRGRLKRRVLRQSISQLVSAKQRDIENQHRLSQQMASPREAEKPKGERQRID